MEVGAESKETRACLYLFLARQLIKFQLELLVINVDNRKLLAVIARRGVSDGFEDEVHLFLCDRLTLVAPDTAALHHCLFYAFHSNSV